MSETHERMWHEWYDGWHNADASKPKPSYEEWLEEHIRVLEQTGANLAEEFRSYLITDNHSHDAAADALHEWDQAALPESPAAASEDKSDFAGPGY